MSVAYVVVTLLTAAANAGIAVADFVRAPFVVANSTAVNVSPRWLPHLGALKLAGAVGLVLGLLGVWFIGVAAAAGLVLFFVGAIVVHIRAGEYATIPAGPGVFLALSVASLVLALAR